MKPTMNTILKIAAAVLMVAATGRSVAARGLDTDAYARVLQRFVTADGAVRYTDLKAHPTDLERALAGFAAMRPAELEALSEAERIAFWINAYNAITLKTIIDNFPIKARGFSALRYPSSSIRQISGAWSHRAWTVAGRKMSLDDIEHKILRKRFDEPRIHTALVCAAKGCPPLRRAPYRGDRLDSQLDDQARRYLASPAGLRVAPGGGKVAVSAIFKWFRDDFDSVGGVRTFLAAHAPAEARAALSDGKTKITYLDYDWSLNEARGD